MTDQDNVAHIPVQQYQLDYYGYWRSGTCRSIRCVSIPTHKWPRSLCALSTLNNMQYIVMTNSTAEEYVTSFGSEVYLEN
jgi:hypothetical protein